MTGYHINKIKGWTTIDFYLNGDFKSSVGGYNLEEAFKRLAGYQFQDFCTQKKLTKRDVNKLNTRLK